MTQPKRRIDRKIREYNCRYHPPVQSNAGTSTLPHQGLSMHRSTQSYDRLLDTIAQRRLGGVTLLWVSAHQPLAFFAGQLCWLVAPLALLCGWDQVETWAAALSAPHSGERLARDLRHRTAQYNLSQYNLSQHNRLQRDCTPHSVSHQEQAP